MKYQNIFLFVFAFAVCTFFNLTNSTAQFRDTISQQPTREDSIFENAGLPRPNAFDLGVQFIAAEAAFNATFFAFNGNGLITGKGVGQEGLSLGAIGLFVSSFTTPLAISLATNELDVRSGSYWSGLMGGLYGFCFGPAISARLNKSSTYFSQYLGYSLPIVVLAIVGYNLPVWMR